MMSSIRKIVTDLPKELRHILGEDEEAYYKGKTKRYAPVGEPVLANELFVILHDHEFIRKDTIEDLQHRDIVNTLVKKCIFSTEVELKTKFHGNDKIAIQAVSIRKAYEINACNTSGIDNHHS